MNPTKEQKREFWIQYGLTEGTCGWLYDTEPNKPIYPAIDLNSLWEYAVPKATDKIMAEQECSSDVAYAILFKKWLQELEVDIPHAARALFWALWKLRRELLGAK